MKKPPDTLKKLADSPPKVWSWAEKNTGLLAGTPWGAIGPFIGLLISVIASPWITQPVALALMVACGVLGVVVQIFGLIAQYSK